MRWMAALLALALWVGSAQAQIVDPGACDRCINARTCPTDAENCRLNCQRTLQAGITPDLVSATERCIQLCNGQFDSCLRLAQQQCALSRACLQPGAPTAAGGRGTP